MQSNSFQGTIPPELSSLVALTLLQVYQNNFSGSFPSTMSAMTSLAYVRLGTLATTLPQPVECMFGVRGYNPVIVNLNSVSPLSLFESLSLSFPHSLCLSVCPSERERDSERDSEREKIRLKPLTPNMDSIGYATTETTTSQSLPSQL